VPVAFNRVSWSKILEVSGNNIMPSTIEKKAFAAAKAEPTFRGTLLKKSIKMKGE